MMTGEHPHRELFELPAPLQWRQLGTIDLGFDLIVLSDAVCSGADQTDDAAVDLLGDRFPV